jgi:hypothetical protein
MFWNRIVMSALGVLLMTGQTPFAHESHVPDLDELLSYSCARSVASMLDTGSQTGPLYVNGILAFTSTDASDGSAVLIASAGGGTYALPLRSKGVNRIRFEIPTGEYSHKKEFFISYMHDDTIRSRYFEFSMGRPPNGHDDLDFTWVEAQRAAYMLPNFEYAIYQTAKNEVTAMTEGRLRRGQFNRHRADCEHLTRHSPALAQNLKHNLDMLEVILTGPGPMASAQARLPASLPSAVELGVDH